MIEAKELSLRYPDGTDAILKADLSVKKGEIVFVTGPSGSGKTSLLQLFLGMYTPTSGSLSVMAQDMTQLTPRNTRDLRQLIGPIFQDFRLVTGRNSLENVIAGIRFLKARPADCKKEALNALERVGLASKAYSQVEHLSWGERQRVSIARAMARKPRLILADEPTGNLDRENALRIIGLLSSFKDSETTVIITTHATHLIESFASDAIIHIDRGVLILERRGQA